MSLKNINFFTVLIGILALTLTACAATPTPGCILATPQPAIMP